jgi:hypothetical protein
MREGVRFLADGPAVLTAHEWREFWRSRGTRERRLVLWAAWDPIGSGVPLDEYDDHLFRIASLLGSRAGEEAIAQELGRIRTGPIGLEPDPLQDASAAEKIVLWFEDATR